MGLEIGAGITLGGGISLVVESAGGGGGGGGGGGELATGTITVGNQIDTYGWGAAQFGDSTFSMMGPIIGIKYEAAYPRTAVYFFTGTYGDVVIDFETVDGETSVTVVIDGITEVLEMNGSGIAIITGDPFGLENKVSQTLNVSVTPGVAEPAPTASGTITVASSSGQYGFNSISAYGTFGSSTIDPAMVEYIAYNPGAAGGGGGTQIMFINGTYGDVVVENSTDGSIAGETFVSVTTDGITRVKRLASYGNSGPIIELNGDPFGLQTKDTQTLNVSITAGTGTLTTYAASSNWTNGIWENAGFWKLTLTLDSTPDSTLVTKLGEINFGTPITITDGSDVSKTVAAEGQANIVGSSVEIYLATGPDDNNTRYTINSISLP